MHFDCTFKGKKRTINDKLNYLENEGKIRVKDFGVKYKSSEPFANLALALGLYKGPSVAYILVDKISKPREEKKFLLFGKKVVRDSFDGDKNDLEKMLEPLGKGVIKNNYSKFSEVKNHRDSIYYDVAEPNVLVVLRSKNSYDGKHNSLEFSGDIYHGMYYKDIKKESEKNEK